VPASSGKRKQRKGHRQIAADLREKIKRGELPADAKLSPQRTLAEEYGVTTQTVSNAIRLLREEGVLRADSTTGVYVAGMPSDPITLEGVDQRTAGLAEDVSELRDRVGALEAKLHDLYARSAQSFQPNNGPTDAQSKRRKSS
jgi:DNA-binding GntR family transcriptional regulator